MSSGELGAVDLGLCMRPIDGGSLHAQIEDQLRRLIRSGELPPDTVLPGEHHLAANLQLSRHTIRHALTTLANEGLVRRERGRGTRVLAPLASVNERRLDHFYAFAWEVSALGLEQRSPVLEFATLQASAEVAERLNLVRDREVQRIVRIRTAGGEPLVLETAYLPRFLADGLDSCVLEQASIYDEIERLHAVRVTRAHETLRPTIVRRSIAKLLRVPVSSPAFRIERTTWAGSQPLEWQESIVRGDRFLYSVELNRPDASGV